MPGLDRTTFPPWLTCRHVIRPKTNDFIGQAQWSPDGRRVAIPCRNNVQVWTPGDAFPATVQMGYRQNISWSADSLCILSETGAWNVRTGKRKQRFSVGRPFGWAPNGKYALVGTQKGSLRVVLPLEGLDLFPLRQGVDRFLSVAWSPDSRYLALVTANAVLIWNVLEQRRTFGWTGSFARADCAAWSTDGATLFIGLSDGTIRQWEVTTGREVRVLEGHSGRVNSLSLTGDGTLMVSTTSHGDLHVWRTETGALLAQHRLPVRGVITATFHPDRRSLAISAIQGEEVYLCDLAADIASGRYLGANSLFYSNAKVVLVGDSGVGKSGLGLVLTGQGFRPTDSTHGRHVWTLDTRVVRNSDGQAETREILLWDLAGQPGYRLIHQLHLGEVAIALVVFDSRNETDPFAGVRHWARALRQAAMANGQRERKVVKFLVAARIDRGGVTVSRARLDQTLVELGFDGYFETSAREGWGIAELAQAIRDAVPWDELARGTSTDLFQNIKQFLLRQKETGRQLETEENLYQEYVAAHHTWQADQRAFSACVDLLQDRGLIRRLGKQVLLQPELLDAYASALVNAARDEPDGLGCIAEENALEGRFPMSRDERVADRSQEKLLLFSTVEDLVHHEIALKEEAEPGLFQLVFPSQFTKDHPNAPDPEGKAIVFTFEGPIMNIYTTLAVRLAHSDHFRLGTMFRNAAIYQAGSGEDCGMWLRQVEEGKADLTLFYAPATPGEVRSHFEEFIRTHLERRSLPGSVRYRRVIDCPECRTTLSNQQVERRLQMGYTWIRCNVCDTRISLEGREPAGDMSDTVVQMEQAADARRDELTNQTRLRRKETAGDYDLVLTFAAELDSYANDLEKHLRHHGVYPLLSPVRADDGPEQLATLERALPTARYLAVLVDHNAFHPWPDPARKRLEHRVREEGVGTVMLVLDGRENPSEQFRHLSAALGTEPTWAIHVSKRPDGVQSAAALLVQEIASDQPAVRFHD